MTLEVKRGNAFDTASLLIALLRVSNIEARYVYGTVQVPIAELMNWLRVDTPDMALSLLADAAIPYKPFTVGGVIAFVQLEHVWVDAWIDFYPSRGTVHRQGDSWVPLDASFKQYTLTSGLDLSTAVPFDVDSMRQYLLDATLTNESGGVTGIQSWYMKNVLAAHQAELQTYIDTHQIEPNTIFDRHDIMPSGRSVFAASLPYQHIATLDTFAEIPDRYRHALVIKFYNSASSQALDNPIFSHTLNFPVIGTQRISVTYEPATAEDAQALADFAASDATAFPVSLFKVKPVLTLDDTVLATGSAMTMGAAQYYTVTVRYPHTQFSHRAQATAGDVLVFGVNGNGITPALIEKRLNRVASDTPAENMHQAALHFWMEHDRHDAIAAQAHGVYRQRMPSVGVFALPLSVHYFLGVPSTGIYQSRKVDVQQNMQIVVAATHEARFDYMTQSGMHGSYLEGAILDRLFGRQRYPGVSSSQVLLEASQQNIPIYTVTADNVDTVLPLLQVSADVKTDIQHAVRHGQHAIIPEREIKYGDWQGSGYVLQDLVTGSGVYLLEGGDNGGRHGLCFSSSRPPVAALNPLSLGQMMRASEALSVFLAEWYAILDRITSDINYSDKEAQAALLTASRVLASTVSEIASGVTAHGCLEILAFKQPLSQEPSPDDSPNGASDSSKNSRDQIFIYENERENNEAQIYVPFEINQDKADGNEHVIAGLYKENVTVYFSRKVPSDDICEADSVVWDFGDGHTTSDVEVAHTYTQTGRYEVTLKANCKDKLGFKKVPTELNLAVYVTKVDLDVREHYYPVNQISPDDPRLSSNWGSDDWLARNKLLVWHDENHSNRVSFDAVKLDTDSEFWVEVIGTVVTSGRGKLYNPNNSVTVLDGNELKRRKLDKLTKDNTDQIYKLDLGKLSNRNHQDALVRYGLDYDQSGSLEKENRHGQDEIFGEYEIYAITENEYKASQDYLNKRILPNVLSALGYSLVYRVINGIFPEPESEEEDYRPEHIVNPKQLWITEDKNAYKALTHRCGTDLKKIEHTLKFVTKQKVRKNGTSIFAVDDWEQRRRAVTIAELVGLSNLNYPLTRKHPDAEAKIKVYYYGSDSDTSALIGGRYVFRKAITQKIIKDKEQISYAEIDKLYNTSLGGRQKVVLTIKKPFTVEFGPVGSVGLGDITIQKKYRTQQGQMKDSEIHLWVEKKSSAFRIDQAHVKLQIEDLFDYNYFKPGASDIAGASRSAAMLQCGFGKHKLTPDAGEVGLVRIEIDGAVQIYSLTGMVYISD